MKYLLLMLIAFPLLAGNLQLQEGVIKAHTEDLISNIDPVHKELKIDLNIGDDITSLNGDISIEMGLFKSDNSDRDEDMYEKIFDIKRVTFANYKIMKVTKDNVENNFIISGELFFRGVIKEISFKAKIIEFGSTLTIDATSSMNISEFGVEPPCLVFVCVRDKVDLTVNVVLKK